MMSIKEKFENLIIGDLPEHLQFEFNLIQKETDDFNDDDLIDIYKANFNYFYFVVKDKHPTCLRDYIPPFEEPEPLEPELSQEQIEKEKKANALAEKFLNKKKQEKLDKANLLAAKFLKKN